MGSIPIKFLCDKVFSNLSDFISLNQDPFSLPEPQNQLSNPDLGYHDIECRGLIIDQFPIPMPNNLVAKPLPGLATGKIEYEQGHPGYFSNIILWVCSKEPATIRQK